MKSRTSRIWVLMAFGLSMLLTWVGSRSSGDDVGIVGSVILLSTFTLGLMSPPRDRLWMLVIGGGIPLVGLLVTQHSGFVVAFLSGVIGASAGALGRKVVAVFRTALT